MRPLTIMILGLSLAGCSSPSAQVDEDPTTCGTCDTPDDHDNRGEGEKLCRAREAEVLRGDQLAFTADAIRWSCADVTGVNTQGKDDRGQEYCEYFAVVQLPGAAQSTLLGRELKGAQQQSAVGALTLSAADRDQLDQHSSDEVGRCVFTSWHSDVAGPVPACSGSTCPKVVNTPVTEAAFRMQDSINSNNAARALVQDCLDPLHRSRPLAQQQINELASYPDPFMRGCMLDFDLYHTEWRKSDPAICAAAMRLTECNCGTAATVTLAGAAKAQAIASALVPEQRDRVTLRGFPLGGWAGINQLPASCEYVDIGAETNGQASHTIVSCKLTGDDVLTNAGDLKQLCRNKYGDNVVVHVPIPSAAVSCDPVGSTALTCGSQPWVITK